MLVLTQEEATVQKLPQTSPPLMLTILPLLSFSWEGDWESTLLSLFLQGHCEREHIFSALDGSFCVQGYPIPSAPMSLFARREGSSYLIDKSLNWDGVSFVLGYEESPRG